MPSKVLCEASTATTAASSAPEIAAAPGNFANGVCATTRPRPVATRIVQVVAEIMLDTGRKAARNADSVAASNARPSHTSTESAVAGLVASGAVVESTTLE